jgi:hypothetical protein
VWCGGRRSRRTHLGPASALLLAALLLGGCGGGDEAPEPTGPGSPPTPPPASPTPEPPLSATCERLPLGSATYTCKDEASTFYGDVVDAIATLQSERPEYFRGDIVTNEGGYYAGLIRILDRRRLCAAFDGEELAVKSSSEFSEHFKVLTSWGQIRRDYKGVCLPAVFPLARTVPPPAPAGCSLAPSTWAACGWADPQFLADVEAAIDQVLREKPELFDFSQTAPGSDWPLVRDLGAYHLAVTGALSAKGYCGLFDGEEIQLKRSNEFSEHYDVNLQDRYVRRGPGTFRGSCYPAAF